MGFELAWPGALLLLALPVLAAVWAAWRGRSLRPALRVPSLAGLARAPRGLRVRLRPLLTVVRVLVLAALVVALARPRLGESYDTVTTEGIDIVLALDTSGSMLAEDMAGGGGRINRLQAAKEVAADFVKGRAADRIGLISFDEFAVPRCPPTLDYGVLLDLLGQVEIDDEGGKTAIGTAVASAVNRLRESEAASRIVILVTDGRSNAGRIEPSDAAEMARLLGVRVYTIGIGTRGEAPYPVRGPFGVRSYQRIRSDIDEDTLKEIARVTNGEYFRATHRGELEGIFQLVDELERTDIEVESHVRHRELFPEVLRGAALLLGLMLVAGATWWEDRAVSVSLRTVLSFAALGALGLVIAGASFLAGAVLAAPAWLHLAWLAPGLLLLDAVAARRRLKARARLGEPEAVARLVEGRGPGLRALRALLAAGAVLLLAVACARPQWGVGEEQLQRRGVDVLLCVDVSRSMLAEDQKPNRLQRARLTVDSLLARMKGNRVGILAYAGEARVLCPLTLDHAAARLFLDTLDPAVLQRPGTAIGSALRLSGRLLQNDQGRNGAVVLLTDGEDHGGDAVEAAEELAARGIVVHAVGFGSPEGTPIPLREESGGRSRRVGFVKDAEGNAVMTRLEQATLEAVVAAAGGRFVRAGQGEVAIAALAQEIAAMDQQDFSARKTRTRPDRYAWYLVPALLLLAAEAFLPDGGAWRRRRDRATRLAAATWSGRKRRDAA